MAQDFIRMVLVPEDEWASVRGPGVRQSSGGMRAAPSQLPPPAVVTKAVQLDNMLTATVSSKVQSDHEKRAQWRSQMAKYLHYYRSASRPDERRGARHDRRPGPAVHSSHDEQIEGAEDEHDTLTHGGQLDEERMDEANELLARRPDLLTFTQGGNLVYKGLEMPGVDFMDAYAAAVGRIRPVNPPAGYRLFKQALAEYEAPSSADPIVSEPQSPTQAVYPSRPEQVEQDQIARLALPSPPPLPTLPAPPSLDRLPAPTRPLEITRPNYPALTDATGHIEPTYKHTPPDNRREGAHGQDHMEENIVQPVGTGSLVVEREDMSDNLAEARQARGIGPHAKFRQAKARLKRLGGPGRRAKPARPTRTFRPLPVRSTESHDMQDREQVVPASPDGSEDERHEQQEWFVPERQPDFIEEPVETTSVHQKPMGAAGTSGNKRWLHLPERRSGKKRAQNDDRTEPVKRKRQNKPARMKTGSKVREGKQIKRRRASKTKRSNQRRDVRTDAIPLPYEPLTARDSPRPPARSRSGSVNIHETLPLLALPAPPIDDLALVPVPRGDQADAPRRARKRPYDGVDLAKTSSWPKYRRQSKRKKSKRQLAFRQRWLTL
jgi:hypothetical protein